MDFKLQRGQHCLIRIDERESEAVKIAVSNLAVDLEKTLGITAQVCRVKEKSVTEPERAETVVGASGAVAGEPEKPDAVAGKSGAVAAEPERAETVAGVSGAVAGEPGRMESVAGASGAVAGEPEKPDAVAGKSGASEGGSKIPEILVGTVGVSAVTESLADPALLRDEKGNLRREAYLHKVHGSRLVIAGTDRRGTIYGIYELCEALGVSPWYFWADVPVKQRDTFVLEGDYRKADYPSVEYRGIFINDEEELEAWVQGYMGEPTIGVKTYEKVFELLLRLKGNYIWPAMHVNSFNLLRENGALADRMGIVVGTSHCDMLMRSNNREWIPWTQRKGYTDAVYDYSIEGRNREILREYWRESVEQNKDFEVCYTLGMRGIHDSGFETKNLEGRTKEEIRSAKVSLLEKIIGDQREILQDVLGTDTMMTFIPYKEVLELYDNGLKIPEDMTLVWANDNYGYIRRYPSEKEKGRRGGNGIYYHNSYWAPPSMSYVFFCSIPLAHTRNELQKAWNEGIRKLWVLNSGAMKPLEQEITFFLRLAWEIGKPGALTENVEAWVEDWIDRTFTGGIGKEVSRLLNDFSQLTNVRKLENMDTDVFSQTAYGDEAVVRIHKYEELFRQGNALYEGLPEAEKDAFFQLVLMRIQAAYFTNLSYYYGDRSILMHDRGNMQAAALYTEKSREAEDARRRLLYYYNHVMCGGKWKGILNPEGFPPPRAAMMPVCTPPLEISGRPSMEVYVWNGEEELVFVTVREKWIEIGNRGTGEFRVSIQAPEWVKLSEERMTVSGEKRILVSVEDVSSVRKGELLVKNLEDGSCRSIPVRTENVAAAMKDGGGQAEGRSAAKDGGQAEGRSAAKDGGGQAEDKSAAKNDGGQAKDRPAAMEEDGLIALEAGQPQSGLQDGGDFKVVPRLGRMQGDLVEARVQREPEDASAQPLCYGFVTGGCGDFLLEIHRFPSLNSVGRIRIGVSLDQGPVQIAESFSNDEWRGNWKKNVLNNVDRLYLQLSVPEAGEHRLFLWAVDRYFAFSRLVIYTGIRKENNLAGIRGGQSLPMDWDMTKWCDDFYGKRELPPRPVFYSAYGKSGNGLALTCRVAQAKRYGKRVEPCWYLEQGSHVFREEGGAVRIDAAAALARSHNAWTEDAGESGLWRHCAGESFGRSGLAMYIRTPEGRWERDNTPSLNYRMLCEGGVYTFWMLSKFNVREEGAFALGIDGKKLPSEQLYGKGNLWRYEAEQIYRWVPVTRMELSAGEHLLQVYALASGMRYDRFYITGGEEEPPMDEAW